VTVAQGLPAQVAFAAWVILAGHVIAQVGRLLTVTEKLQAATTFGPSLPVQLTVLSPTGKLEPDAGLHVIVKLGQGPTAVAVE
jgi:hypothetical protein